MKLASYMYFLKGRETTMALTEQRPPEYEIQECLLQKLEGCALSQPLRIRNNSLSSRVPRSISYRQHSASHFASLCCTAVSIMLICGYECAAQQEISFEQAVGYAMKQNRDLALLRLSAESSGVTVEDEKGRFKFGFTPEGALNKTDGTRVSTYGLSAARKTVLGTDLKAEGQVSETEYDGGTNLYRDTVTVSLEQPLLRYAGVLVNRESLTAAESRLAAARREIELKKTDLVVQIAEVYEEQLSLQTEIELESMTAKRLEKLFKFTHAKERQGRATRADSLRAEIKLGESQLRIGRIQERLEAVRSDLAELLGFPPDVEFKVVPYPLPAIPVDGVGTAVAVALSNRLDYAQVLQDCKDAERGLRIARRGLLPDIRLTTSYQKSGEGDSGSAASKLDDNVWFFGLTAKSELPLRSERNAVKQADIGLDASKMKIDAVKDDISKQVMQALASCERSKSEIVTAEKNYRLAQSRALSARRMFERGRGDSFTVSDAEDGLKDAEANWLSAQADASLTAYRFLRVAGLLLEYPNELKPGSVI
jgi:outer membrane protein TolC